MTDLPDIPAKSSIQVIDRMMSLIAALARHPSPANLKQLAAEAGIKPEYQEYALEEANRALSELKQGKIRGAKVLRL